MRSARLPTTMLPIKPINVPAPINPIQKLFSPNGSKACVNIALEKADNF